VEVGVLPRDPCRLVAGHALDALPAVEVVLHPVFLTLCVDPQVSVRAVAVHVPPRARQAPVAHQVGDLVGGLRVECPEVPLHVVVAKSGVGHTFLTADEVRELHWVAHEEHRRVVADEVEVALSGVEPQGKATHVPPGVGGAEFARHGRESGQHTRRGAGGEHRRLRIGRHVTGRHELAERAGAFGMRFALGDVLAVEVGQGVDQVEVVQQQRPVGADGQRVAVADGGRAARSGRP